MDQILERIPPPRDIAQVSPPTPREGGGIGGFFKRIGSGLLGGVRRIGRRDNSRRDQGNEQRAAVTSPNPSGREPTPPASNNVSVPVEETRQVQTIVPPTEAPVVQITPEVQESPGETPQNREEAPSEIRINPRAIVGLMTLVDSDRAQELKESIDEESSDRAIVDLIQNQFCRESSSLLCLEIKTPQNNNAFANVVRTRLGLETKPEEEVPAVEPEPSATPAGGEGERVAIVPERISEENISPTDTTEEVRPIVPEGVSSDDTRPVVTPGQIQSALEGGAARSPPRSTGSGFNATTTRAIADGINSPTARNLKNVLKNNPNWSDSQILTAMKSHFGCVQRRGGNNGPLCQILHERGTLRRRGPVSPSVGPSYQGTRASDWESSERQAKLIAFFKSWFDQETPSQSPLTSNQVQSILASDATIIPKEGEGGRVAIVPEWISEENTSPTDATGEVRPIVPEGTSPDDTRPIVTPNQVQPILGSGATRMPPRARGQTPRVRRAQRPRSSGTNVFTSRERNVLLSKISSPEKLRALNARVNPDWDNKRVITALKGHFDCNSNTSDSVCRIINERKLENTLIPNSDPDIPYREVSMTVVNTEKQDHLASFIRESLTGMAPPRATVTVTEEYRYSPSEVRPPSRATDFINSQYFSDVFGQNLLRENPGRIQQEINHNAGPGGYFYNSPFSRSIDPFQY